jgi:Homeodomain-like domain
MRRLSLTATAQAHREQRFTTTNDRRLRDRCQAIVMAHRGRKRQTIAQELGGPRTPVRLWLKQYAAQGVEGIPLPWGPRQRGRIPETLAPTMQAWVKAGPQECGLDRAHGPYEAWATSLYQSTGRAVKRTARRVFCQRHALRPSRPTYRDLRGAPEQPHAARADLPACKKKPTRARACCGAKMKRVFPWSRRSTPPWA